MASLMIARACGSGSTARRCSYQPIASASSVSEAHRRANVRVSAGSSSGGSWYWSNPIGSPIWWGRPRRGSRERYASRKCESAEARREPGVALHQFLRLFVVPGFPARVARRL